MKGESFFGEDMMGQVRMRGVQIKQDLHCLGVNCLRIKDVNCLGEIKEFPKIVTLGMSLWKYLFLQKAPSQMFDMALKMAWY